MYGHSLSQFVHETHTRRTSPIPTESIGIAAARTLADMVDWDRMAEIAQEARKYLPYVMAEIETLVAAHAANPERMKRRAFLFGISTPNRDERQSIAWALAAEPWLDTLSPYALVRRTYTSHTGNRVKLGFYDSISSALFHGWLNDYALDVDTLERIPGCGPKVARMIHAVANPDADVWTVDLWHTRQLLWAAGLDYRVRVSLTKEAYPILEEVWLNYAHTFFPEVPVWAVQWATWCAADGRFVTHAHLWADLVH